MGDVNIRPFEMRCNKCGGTRVEVWASTKHDLELECKDCKQHIQCGSYDTDKIYDENGSVFNMLKEKEYLALRRSGDRADSTKW